MTSPEEVDTCPECGTGEGREPVFLGDGDDFEVYEQAYHEDGSECFTVYLRYNDRQSNLDPLLGGTDHVPPVPDWLFEGRFADISRMNKELDEWFGEGNRPIYTFEELEAP